MERILLDCDTGQDDAITILTANRGLKVDSKQFFALLLQSLR